MQYSCFLLFLNLINSFVCVLTVCHGTVDLSSPQAAGYLNGLTVVVQGWYVFHLVSAVVSHALRALESVSLLVRPKNSTSETTPTFQMNLSLVVLNNRNVIILLARSYSDFTQLIFMGNSVPPHPPLSRPDNVFSEKHLDFKQHGRESDPQRVLSLTLWWTK